MAPRQGVFFSLRGNCIAETAVVGRLKAGGRRPTRKTAFGRASPTARSIRMKLAQSPTVVAKLRAKVPLLWENTDLRALSELTSLSVQPRHYAEAAAQWIALRPLLVLLFGEEARSTPWGPAGTISSPLRSAPKLGRILGLNAGSQSRCFIKEDSRLAVCGSVKARGGMFEVLADKYGSSSILDIKRQDSEWGKSVAMAFSQGDVATGLSILGEDNRIKWDKDANSSMQELLHDWSLSGDRVRDRLILAVKNKDVAALNHGAREHFKLEGKLTGDEFEVNGNHFMRGDRVLITKTDKKLGLTNGDLAEISHTSEDKFTLRFRYDENVNNDKYISFNPSEYNGFRHGYATTVFKAQGASIKDVYVYHDGFSTIRNSYVSLSRHIDELRLYVNKESTSDMSILTRQLANDFEHGSSLRYMSVLEHKELAENKTAEESFGKLDTMLFKLFNAYDFVHNNITKLADKHIPVSEYYNYQEPDKAVLPVEKVLDQIAVEQEAVGMGIEDKIAVGDNNVQITSTLEQNTNTTTKSKMTAKERFYANVDHSRNRANSRADLKQQWDRESHELREATKFKAEQITRGLLGDPNNKLSNKSTLRYGEYGKLAVRISGDKAGTWYDFSKSEGGDIFSLVQDAKNTSFKEAAEYLKSSVGMTTNTDFKPNLQLVYDHANSETTKPKLEH